MEEPVLTDKNQFPTEEIITSHIGKAKALWTLLFDAIHRDHPEISEEWRYYLDGKSWLLKVTRKGKTIFWLSLVDGSFRTTFYFGDKAARAIARSAISDPLKKQFKGGKHYGKIRGVTILYKKKQDVEDARALIELKLGIQ
jgi:hypothetical protein